MKLPPLCFTTTWEQETLLYYFLLLFLSSTKHFMSVDSLKGTLTGPKLQECIFSRHVWTLSYTDGSSTEDSYNYISNNHFKPKQTVPSEKTRFLNRHTRKQNHLTLSLQQHCSQINSFLIKTVFCSAPRGAASEQYANNQNRSSEVLARAKKDF